MAGRHPVPARWALVGALAVALLAPAAGIAAPGGDGVAAELERARDRIERTSAELARARSAADGLGRDARAELERLERRLQAQKDALIELESGLAARHADQPAAAAAPPEEAAGTDEDGPVVVLGERPSTAAPASAPITAPLAPPGVQTAQQQVPAAAGGDLAATIDGYLASKASPLTGLGAVFVAESRRVGLDPRFLVAIAGSETSFGTYGPSQAIHNPFGMGPHIQYPSWEAAIAAAATNLSGGFYLGEGRFTIGAIQQRWAPHGASNDPTNLNSNWARNVSTYYAELGGDPVAPVFTEEVTSGAGVPAAPALPGGSAAAPVVYAAAAPLVSGASGAGPAAAEAALSVLGTRSVREGASPGSGFDAPGLVRWAYGRQGVSLPRSAPAQARVGTPVEPQDLEAGDAILFADTAGRVIHAGLYLGDGQFVHAPGAGDIVKISSLYEAFFAEAYAGARRY